MGDWADERKREVRNITSPWSLISFSLFPGKMTLVSSKSTTDTKFPSTGWEINLHTWGLYQLKDCPNLPRTLDPRFHQHHLLLPIPSSAT